MKLVKTVLATLLLVLALWSKPSIAGQGGIIGYHPYTGKPLAVIPVNFVYAQDVKTLSPFVISQVSAREMAALRTLVQAGAEIWGNFGGRYWRFESLFEQHGMILARSS